MQTTSVPQPVRLDAGLLETLRRASEQLQARHSVVGHPAAMQLEAVSTRLWRPLEQALSQGTLACDARVEFEGEDQVHWEVFLFRTDDEQLLPVVWRKPKAGNLQVELHPALDANRDGLAAFDQLLAGLEKSPKIPPDALVMRFGRPEVTSWFEGQKLPLPDGGFALYNVVSSLLQLARRETQAQDRTPTDFAPKQEAHLAALLNPEPKGEVRGPMVGDDLLAALSWNGLPVVVTSERHQHAPIHIWVYEKVGDRRVWVEVTPPTDAEFPRRSATVLIRNSMLLVSGGVNEQGEPLSAQWMYHLGKGQPGAYPERLWQQTLPLPEPRALPHINEVRSDQVIAGGLSGSFRELLPGLGGEIAESRSSIVSRATFVQHLSGMPSQRAPMPEETHGGSAASDGDWVIYGPGATRSGALYAYNPRQGFWEKLPALPEGFGQGQLHVLGSKLVYTGGYRGGPDSKQVSDVVYVLDRDAEAAQWVEAGRVPATAGLARVVNDGGRWMAVMVRPEGGSTCVYLS